MIHSIPADPNLSSISIPLPTSADNSPAGSGSSTSSRPSSLDGLKFKLKQTYRSPRRKSCGHIPLSPLARANGSSSPPVTGALILNNTNTQGISPHLLSSTSPTSRSPSPLAILSNQHSSSPCTSSPLASSTSGFKGDARERLSFSSQGASGTLSGNGNRLAPIGAGFARRRINSHPNRPQSVIVGSSVIEHEEQSQSLPPSSDAR